MEDHECELSKTLSNALKESGIVRLSNGEEITISDVVQAITELAKGYLELTYKLEALERREAEVVVERILSNADYHKFQDKRELMVNLKMTAPETFEALFNVEGD